MNHRVVLVVAILCGCVSQFTPADCNIASPTSEDFAARFWTVGHARFKVVAHRGFTCCHPENTVVAIEQAFAMGAHAVELDVRLTKDGVPVLMHDGRVDRTTDGTGLVSDMTLRELQRLDACTWFDRSLSPCPVPTLGEALFAAKDRGAVVLDLKGRYDSCDLVRVLSEVRESEMFDAVALAGFDNSLATRARRQVPGMATALFVFTGTEIHALTPQHTDLVFLKAAMLDTLPSHALDAVRARGLRLGVWNLHAEPDIAQLVNRDLRWFVTDSPIEPIPTVPQSARTRGQ